MTDSEMEIKYPHSDYTYKHCSRKTKGHQDSIEETIYEIVDKKNNEVVARVKHTEVQERGREPTSFWE
ncbi:TPA: hypothetical protein OMT82_000420 [Enterobacter cloacae]|nr:hypothetical protein [Enterobacter cloacae]HCR0905068.1 hypothetical protein [Enterobacter cloacae]